MTPNGRSRTLRRRWRFGLGVMIAALSLALTGTSVAYLRVIDHYRTAARRLDAAVSLSSDVQKAVADHEGLAHLLWNGSRVDLPLYLRQQHQIEHRFTQGLAEITKPNEAHLLAKASRLWRGVLQSRGLWGPPAHARAGVTLAEQQRFGSGSDQVTVALSRLSTVAIADSTGEIARADALQSRVVWLLVSLFALVVGLAVLAARRLTVDVLRPIEQLQRAAARLQNGELDHRIRLSSAGRPSELGELAETFNAMAGALAASHRRLSHQATHDSLTGVSNRAAFERHLERHFEPGTAGLQQIGVLFIDIDDFKAVNDSAGHAAGDALLEAVAVRLAKCVRSSDLVARLGGDEFAILVVDDPPAASSAVGAAKRVLENLAGAFLIAGQSITVGASIGVSLRLPETASAAELLAQADAAMYAAKARGKNQRVVFESGLDGEQLLDRGRPAGTGWRRAS